MQKDNDGCFPLFEGVWEKDMVKIVEMLIENGTNVNETDVGGISSLFIASQQGYNQIVELLI